MGIVLAYMTAADKAEAEKIGRALIESKLAACVNIVDGMSAMYRWEGKIQQERETILIAKTTEEKVDPLKDRVSEIHSYDCPCILVFRVYDGYAPFMTWIQEQVILE